MRVRVLPVLVGCHEALEALDVLGRESLPARGGGAPLAGLGAKASAGLPSRLKGCSKKRAMESKCQAKQFKHDEKFGAPVPAQNKKTDVDLAFRPNVVLRRRWKDRFQPKIKGQM